MITYLSLRHLDAEITQNICNCGWPVDHSGNPRWESRGMLTFGVYSGQTEQEGSVEGESSASIQQCYSHAHSSPMNTNR